MSFRKNAARSRQLATDRSTELPAGERRDFARAAGAKQVMSDA
jgi:hypothetical protein